MRHRQRLYFHALSTCMQQQTFVEASFQYSRKLTGREWFLADMEQVIPWEELAAGITP